MMPVAIAGTATHAPGPAVSTRDMVARLTSPLDAAEVEARTGIGARYVAPPDASYAELGARALGAALARARLPASALRRIVFVSSVGGEVTIPATANRIAAGLGLAGTCDGFDLNNACMGFLSAFDVAARSVATGTGPVGIAVVELGSRIITPEDARPWVVFGDAVAGVVLVPATDGGAVLASWLRNDGVAVGNVRLRSAQETGRRERVAFTAPSRTMAAEAVEWIRRGTEAVLAEAGLGLDAVDWVLPHQPNGSILASVVRDLGARPERLIPVVQEFGSVGAASIPLSLDRLLSSGRARPGQTILMVGVGAGISAGAALYRVGREGA